MQSSSWSYTSHAKREPANRTWHAGLPPAVVGPIKDSFRRLTDEAKVSRKEVAAPAEYFAASASSSGRLIPIRRQWLLYVPILQDVKVLPFSEAPRRASFDVNEDLREQARHVPAPPFPPFSFRNINRRMQDPHGALLMNVLLLLRTTALCLRRAAPSPSQKAGRGRPSTFTT